MTPDKTTWVPIILFGFNVLLTLVLGFLWFVIHRIVHEIDHTRDKVATLFAMTNESKVATEKLKSELSDKFVRVQDLQQLKDEFCSRLERTEGKVDKILDALISTSSNRARP